MKRGNYKPKLKNEKALKTFLDNKTKTNERDKRYSVGRGSKRECNRI
tara:strand:- start:335 stop:475 length:141 start_codon:yes stop_codon:yes gene_type:complete